MRKGLGSSVATDVTLSADGLLNALATPVIIVDSDCRILHRNAAADKFLSQRSWLWITDSRLNCRDQGLREFEETVRQVIPGVLRPDKFSVVLSGPAGEQALLSGSVVEGDQPLVACTLADPVTRPVADAAVLKKVYGLTESESQVAAMMAEGANYEEIALARSVTVETVRSYTRKIFKKMKVSGRAGVVSSAQAITVPTSVFSDTKVRSVSASAAVC